MAKKSSVIFLDEKPDNRYISDIQRAYLSYVTDWLKLEKFGRKLGYKALGEKLNPKSPLNQSTMQRWHQAVDDIGKSSEDAQVKVIPQEASLEIALHNLPKSGESVEATEELYGEIVESKDSPRKAGYALPITQEMFALVFGLEAENSANLNTRMKALAEKLSALEQWKEEVTAGIEEIQTQLAKLASAQASMKSKSVGHNPDATEKDLDDTVLAQVLTAIAELKEQISGRASTSDVQEESKVPHPLDAIRETIRQQNINLEELASIAGANIEIVANLLHGDLDDVICDQSLPKVERMAALNTLANLVIAINEVSGSAFDSNTILREYYETEYLPHS